MTDNIRILVCDDHALVRSGLIEMLKGNGFIIAGEAANGLQMIEEFYKRRPDIILADLSMPVLSGLDAAKRILISDPETKILLITMHNEEHFIVSSWLAGVKGLIGKDVPREEMFRAITTIASGERYFGAAYSDQIIIHLAEKYKSLDKKPEIADFSLSSRERDMLKYLTEGLMISEIADRMNSSKRTVDALRERLMKKYNLKTFPSLIKFAFEINYKKSTSNSKPN
jgi:DNA-binding NarL/FixJ family response regulator